MYLKHLPNTYIIHIHLWVYHIQNTDWIKTQIIYFSNIIKMDLNAKHPDEFIMCSPIFFQSNCSVRPWKIIFPIWRFGCVALEEFMFYESQ